jgi:inosose dehydratase
MMRLGMHTDNWRHLDRPFEDAVEAAVMLGLDCIEFGVFDGQYFIQALGYNPHLPLTTDPVKVRRYLDSKGLQVSQIDAAYPLTSPEMGPYGVPYIRKAILFAEAIGCPYVDTTDGGSKPPGYTDDEVLVLLKHNLRLLLETAENHGVTVNIETHCPYTTDLPTMQTILQFFDSEHLKVNFDTGNTYISGNDPLEFLKGVRKWVSHLHVKDVAASLAEASRGSSTGIATSIASIGKGVNAKNIEACIHYLQETGWDGVLSVECEGTDEILHPSVDWLKNLIGRSIPAKA